MISKAKIFDHGVAWEAGNSVTQGYQVNNTIYISGQFSHDQNAFVDGDIEAQTRLTLENLDQVLAGFGIPERFAQILAGWDVSASHGALFDEHPIPSACVGARSVWLHGARVRPAAAPRSTAQRRRN